MYVRLGIDASQSPASCAVAEDSKIIASGTIERPIENFPTLIREVLHKANVNINDIDEIVVCIGPGSQTGIRSAVVTGNALALALNIPVSGVLSTDAAAVIVESIDNYQVAVSAGRRRWYVESYKWDDKKLQRVDELKLNEEIPAGAFPVFDSEHSKSEEFIPCANGILMIAAQQRHLIKQSLLCEVMPYENKLTVS